LIKLSHDGYLQFIPQQAGSIQFGYEIEMRNDRPQVEFAQLLKLSVGLLLISFVLTYKHNYSWSWLGNLGFLSIPLGVVIAIAIFYVPVVLISHRLLRLNAFYNLMQDLHFMTRDLSWFQIIVLSVLAGVGEELLFRGFAQSWLLGAIGVYTAIVLTSFVFGMLHAMTLYYFLFAFTLSLGFGVVFQASESMLLVVTIHAVYDVIALGVIAKYPQYVGVAPRYTNEETENNDQQPKL